jgi:hypothetical protein
VTGIRNAQGWMSLEEAWSKFRSVDSATFAAEFMCSRASTKGLICANFSRARHGLRGFRPEPAIGPTFSSTDFGGTNPTSTVHVTFVAAREGVECAGQEGDVKHIPFGAYVFHSEIYLSEEKSRARYYTERVKAVDQGWRNVFPEFRISGRFYDSQSKGARGEWHDHGVILRNYAPKRAQEQALKMAELVDDDLFFVDESCPMLAQEIESWRWDERKGIPLKTTDTQDHSIDAAKYAVANLLVCLLPARNYGKPTQGVTQGQQTAAGHSPWRRSGHGDPFSAFRAAG